MIIQDYETLVEVFNGNIDSSLYPVKFDITLMTNNGDNVIKNCMISDAFLAKDEGFCVVCYQNRVKRVLPGCSIKEIKLSKEEEIEEV